MFDSLTANNHSFMFSLFDLESLFGDIQIVDHDGEKAIIFPKQKKEDMRRWQKAKERFKDDPEGMMEWKLTYPEQETFNYKKRKEKS